MRGLRLRILYVLPRLDALRIVPGYACLFGSMKKSIKQQACHWAFEKLKTKYQVLCLTFQEFPGSGYEFFLPGNPSYLLN